MTIGHPFALILLLLALLPFWVRRAHQTFQFSSFSFFPASSRWKDLGFLYRALIALVLAGLALGIADISFFKRKTINFRKGAQIVFVLDKSSSMEYPFSSYGNSADELSKKESAIKIIELFVLSENQDSYGLVEFSDFPVTLSKLTPDKTRFLKILKMPSDMGGGTDIGKPLIRAMNLFPEDDDLAARAIVLVSDGNGDMGNVTSIARWFTERRIQFWWMFLGNQAEWQIASVHPLVKLLGSEGNAFQAGSGDDLKSAFSVLQSMHRTYLPNPEQEKSVSTSSIFYGLSLGALTLLSCFVLFEISLKPKRRSE